MLRVAVQVESWADHGHLKTTSSVSFQRPQHLAPGRFGPFPPQQVFAAHQGGGFAMPQGVGMPTLQNGGFHAPQGGMFMAGGALHVQHGGAFAGHPNGHGLQPMGRF